MHSITTQNVSRGCSLSGAKDLRSLLEKYYAEKQSDKGKVGHYDLYDM
jgi:hypothetical protein